MSTVYWRLRYFENGLLVQGSMDKQYAGKVLQQYVSSATLPRAARKINESALAWISREKEEKQMCTIERSPRKKTTF